MAKLVDAPVRGAGGLRAMLVRIQSPALTKGYKAQGAASHRELYPRRDRVEHWWPETANAAMLRSELTTSGEPPAIPGFRTGRS